MKTLDKRELPYKVPKIKTYPYFTAIVSILDAYEKADAWIYNNYILLWILKDNYYVDYWIDFKYGNEEIQEEFCKNLKKYVLKRYEISKVYSDINEALIDLISQNYYVLISVDVFYIDNWWLDGKRRHFRHQLCIHGFDKEKRIFFASDFINYQRYTTFTVDFEVLKLAYDNYDSYIPYEDFGNDIWLLSINDQENEEIDIHRIKHLIEDFINSQDTYILNHIQTENKVEKYVFGLDVFDEIFKYINDVKMKGISVLDRRPFYLISLFNKIMLNRVDCLVGQFPDMQKKYENEVKLLLEQQIASAESVLLLALKYNICGNESVLDILLNKITLLKKGEKMMLERIRDLLDEL